MRQADTYLITGGAGFVGSHLAEALLARGDRVIVIDNLSTGRLRNLEALHGNPDLNVVHGSVLDELLVDELVNQSDVVVHLAAAVGVKLIIDQPLRSFTTNIRGSEIVIESAHRYRRKILVASTSEIYGKNCEEPLAEDADRHLGATTVARWAYSTAKAVDEILAYSFHRERGLPSIVVRLFNTVGPRQSAAYGMVVPRLVHQALRGEPLTIFGDGHQTRCFCHVSDVVDAFLRVLAHPDAIGEVFNVGSQEEISINELAHRILRKHPNLAGIQRIPYEQAYDRGFEDMRRRVPDTTKLRQLTGWSPAHQLDDILDETITEVAREQADERQAALATI